MKSKRQRDAANPDRRLRRAERLRTRAQFARVFARKQTTSDDRLVVHLSDNGLPWSRLGVMTSRRVGGAVRRNRARRAIREAFRRNKDALPKGFDILCSVRPGGEDAGLADSLIELVHRAARRLERKRT